MKLSDITTDIYELCPCGSGKKYKFCCLAACKTAGRGTPQNAIVEYDAVDPGKLIASVYIPGKGTIREVFNFIPTGEPDSHTIKQVSLFFASHGATKVTIKAPPPTLHFVEPEDESVVDVEDEFETDEAVMQSYENRVAAILGSYSINIQQGQAIYLKHFQEKLELPCPVKRLEPCNWEYPYAALHWDDEKYARLKQDLPSKTDEYELLRIGLNEFSHFMTFSEDLAAYVRRVSDGKTFVFGLTDVVLPLNNEAIKQLHFDYCNWLMDRAKFL